MKYPFFNALQYMYIQLEGSEISNLIYKRNNCLAEFAAPWKENYPKYYLLYESIAYVA